MTAAPRAVERQAVEPRASNVERVEPRAVVRAWDQAVSWSAAKPWRSVFSVTTTGSQNWTR